MMRPSLVSFRGALATILLLGVGLHYADADPPPQAAADGAAQAGPPCAGLDSLVRHGLAAVGARAVGIFGDCGDHLPMEECAFTLEAARYIGDFDRGTRFNAVCVDANFFANPLGPLSCTPMGRELFAIAADLGVAGSVDIAGGGSAVAQALGLAGIDVGLGFGIELPVERKFKTPARVERIGGQSIGLGGNILIESGLGSVSAGRSVVFSHRRFTGRVSLMATRPDFMTIWVGQAGGGGVSCMANGTPASCPPAFAEALITACKLNRAAVCADIIEEDEISHSSAQAVDAKELDSGWGERLDEINAIKDVVRTRMLERNLAEVFDLLSEFEGAGLREEVRSRFRDSLAEVRELLATVQAETGFANRESSFANLNNLNKSLSGVETNLLNRVNSRTQTLFDNHKDICAAHPGVCALQTILQ